MRFSTFEGLSVRFSTFEGLSVRFSRRARGTSPRHRWLSMDAARLRRYSPSMVRAAIWALRARRRARHVVWNEGIEAPVRLPPAPAGPPEATSVVVGVLARTRATCLVQSLVLQRWFADQGQLFDVVIGVTAPSEGFRAHAWLDRPGEPGSQGFAELHRLAPPGEAYRAGVEVGLVRGR